MEIEYSHDGTALEAYVSLPKGENLPAVLIAHAWRGRDEFVKEKADYFASLGYVGFALDMYGKGVLGSSIEENAKLMQPFVDDRVFLKSRMVKALEELKRLPMVNQNKIGAIGFCFGGMCVLDLARSGADISGVISCHGLFMPSSIDGPVRTKVLALHGYDDPMVSPDQMVAFAEEMTQAKIDWQLHAFGQTQHAFTNPAANDPGLGTVFNPVSNERSWQLVENFFSKILQK